MRVLRSSTAARICLSLRLSPRVSPRALSKRTSRSASGTQTCHSPASSSRPDLKSLRPGSPVPCVCVCKQQGCSLRSRSRSGTCMWKRKRTGQPSASQKVDRGAWVPDDSRLAARYRKLRVWTCPSLAAQTMMLPNTLRRPSDKVGQVV